MTTPARLNEFNHGRGASTCAFGTARLEVRNARDAGRGARGRAGGAAQGASEAGAAAAQPVADRGASGPSRLRSGERPTDDYTEAQLEELANRIVDLSRRRRSSR